MCINDRLISLLSEVNARLLPQVREVAFTHVNIIRGFEIMGIYPYNNKIFPFMRDYYNNPPCASTLAAGSSWSASNSPSCKGNPLFARLLQAPTAEPPTADCRDRRRYLRAPSEY